MASWLNWIWADEQDEADVVETNDGEALPDLELTQVRTSVETQDSNSSETQDSSSSEIDSKSAGASSLESGSASMSDDGTSAEHERDSSGSTSNNSRTNDMASALRMFKRGVMTSTALKWNPSTGSWTDAKGVGGCLGMVGACLLCGIKDPRKKKMAALLLITLQYLLLLVVTIFVALFYIKLMRKDTTGLHGTPNAEFEAFFYHTDCMRRGEDGLPGRYKVLSPYCSLAIPPKETTGTCSLSGEEFTTVIDGAAGVSPSTISNAPMASSFPNIEMPKLSDTVAAIQAIELNLGTLTVIVNGDSWGGRKTAAEEETETRLVVVVETSTGQAGQVTLYENITGLAVDRIPVGSYIAFLSSQPTSEEKDIFVRLGHGYVANRHPTKYAGLSVKLDDQTIIPIDTSGPNSHSTLTHVPGRDDPGYPFLLAGSNPSNIEAVIDHFSSLVGGSRSRVEYTPGSALAGGITVNFFVSPAQASALKQAGYTLQYGDHVCLDDGGNEHISRFGLLSLVALFILPVHYIFVVIKGYFDELTLPDPRSLKSANLPNSKFTKHIASKIQNMTSHALAAALSPPVVSNLHQVLDDLLPQGKEREAVLTQCDPSLWEGIVTVDPDLVAQEILAIRVRAEELGRVDMTNVIERWRGDAVKWYNRLRKLMMVLPILITSFFDGSLVLHKVLDPTTFEYNGQYIPVSGLVISMYMPLYILITTGIAMLLQRMGRARRREERTQRQAENDNIEWEMGGDDRRAPEAQAGHPPPAQHHFQYPQSYPVRPQPPKYYPQPQQYYSAPLPPPGTGWTNNDRPNLSHQYPPSLQPKRDKGSTREREEQKARCHSTNLFKCAKWIHIVNLCIFFLVALFGVYVKGVLLVRFVSGLLTMNINVVVNLIDLGYVIVGLCVFIARLTRMTS